MALHDNAQARHQTIGYAYACGAVALLATSIAVARWGVTRDLGPADLLFLRFGIGGLLFLWPFLQEARRAPRRLLLMGFPLSFAHGWGMAGCVFVGLQMAPASHAGALGPGCTPLWTTLLGAAFFGRKIRPVQLGGIVAITAGMLALMLGAYGGLTTPHALQGDAFFAAAAVLAASYLLYVEKRNISARLGNALVLVMSGVVVVPAYFLFATPRIGTAPWQETAIQALFQGGLMTLAYILIHRAVLLVGSVPVTVLVALVPVFTLATGWLIAGDSVSALEAAAACFVTVGAAVAAKERS